MTICLRLCHFINIIPAPACVSFSHIAGIGCQLAGVIPLEPFLASCSIIFCEAVAIYGVIVAIILQTKIDYVDADKVTGLYPIPAMTAGYAIFGSGITTGWANLACG